MRETRNDNARCLELQAAYLRGGEGASDALGELYALCVQTAFRFINAKAQANPHVAALSLERREEKARNAASYIVEQFLTRPDFRIEKSFSGYLYLRVMHELYYRRKVDEKVLFLDSDTVAAMARKRKN